MKINVPQQARDHFWVEPPAGSTEFWAFRFPPKCKIGDTIWFYFDGKVVAKSIVSAIEKPGQCSCDQTGRFKNSWKVFWTNQSFVDLRQS